MVDNMATNPNLLPTWLTTDERVVERWPMNLPGSLHAKADGSSVDIRIVDISTHGCLIAIDGGAAMGRYVTVTLPGQISSEGWIAWSKGDHAGLDFAQPLPAAMVEHLIGQRGSSGDPDGDPDGSSD